MSFSFLQTVQQLSQPLMSFGDQLFFHVSASSSSDTLIQDFSNHDSCRHNARDNSQVKATYGNWLLSCWDDNWSLYTSIQIDTEC